MVPEFPREPQRLNGKKPTKISSVEMKDLNEHAYGKVTTWSTIMLSWSSGGITGPLEIVLVSATTGGITTIASSIDLGTGISSYKWIVSAAQDTYYLEGNAQNHTWLIYSGNFTGLSNSDSSCLASKQASDPIGASGNAAVAMSDYEALEWVNFQ